MNRKLILWSILYLVLLIGYGVYSFTTKDDNYVKQKNNIKLLQAKYENSITGLDARTPLPTPSSDTAKITPLPTPVSDPVKSTPLPTTGSEKTEVNQTPEPGDTSNLPAESSNPGDKKGSDASEEEGYKSIDFTRNLSMGSTGDDVKKLQYLLKQRNLYNGEIDGIFGNITLMSVKRFQEESKLVIDGVAGINTFRKLLK